MPYIGKSPGKLGVRQRYHYTATGSETSKSGTDDNGLTLKFDDGEYVDVYLNGSLLIAGSDYNTATANTISGLAALTANDVLEVIVYDIYSLAKTNSEAQRTKYYYTATGGETSVSGADDSGATITFSANAQIDVRLNGVSLKQGDDYNTTTANTVGGLTALTAGQLIEIVVYEKFVLADMVKKSGDTMTGGLSVTGDLTVDTNTLHVDAANNNVGIGLSSPLTNYKIHVDSNSDSDGRVARFSQAGTDNAIVDVTAQNGTNTEAFSRYRNDANFFSVGIDSNDNFSIGKSFANTIGNTRVTVLSGGGLTFNGDTAAANALDDYEFGDYDITLTPSSSGSITVNTSENKATYVKIGNFVHAQGRVNVSSVSSPSGDLAINLPFQTTSSQGEQSGSGAPALFVWNSTQTNNGLWCGFFDKGISAFYIRWGNSSTPGQSASYIQAGTEIRFSVSYITDS